MQCGLVLVGGNQPLFWTLNYSQWGYVPEVLVDLLGKSGLLVWFHLCLGGRSVPWFVQGRKLTADRIENYR